MRANLFIAILLQVTSTLAAPAKLDDLVAPSDTLESLSNNGNLGGQNQALPLNALNMNYLGSGLVPSSASSSGHPSLPLSGSGISPNSDPLGLSQRQDQNQPPRPVEYLSDSLRQHNPSKRGLDLPVLGSGAGGSEIMDKLPIKQDDQITSLVSGDTDNGAKDAVNQVLSQTQTKTRNGKNRLGVGKREVEHGSDHLGRRITKKGNEFLIQEPADQGRQWQGAEEMDDDNDEPFWG